MQKCFNQSFTKSRHTNITMKFLVVLAVAVACAHADVSHLSTDYTAPVVKSSYDISPEGAFQYAYETGNGIYAQAGGVVKNPNSEYPSLEIKGGYKYTAPDGTPVELTYTADEEGYKPVSNLLPVAPPVPEAILRSLAYIAANPPAVEGTYQKPSKPASPTYG